MKSAVTPLLNRLLARGKFRHLQVVLKLAELGSVQRTADAFGMTQSSITQTLAYVENLMEAKLFHRHARGVRPTPACMDLLPVARQMMLGLIEGAEIVAARSSQGRTSIRIAASAAAANGLLVRRLPDFHAGYPAIEVLLREAERDDLLMLIARGEVDLVACRHPGVVPTGWTFQPLLDDPLVVVCRPDHPLARSRRVAWSQLGRHAWLLTPAGSVVRERFDNLATQFQDAPVYYPLITRSLSALSTVLQQEQLLSLLPLSIVCGLLQSGDLVALPTREGGTIDPLGLLYPLGHLPEASEALRTFLVRSNEPASLPTPRTPNT
ncbi:MULTISPECIES: LysR substrate-binding domain-containing protein [unclassified Acidovorax]|uniref:LysR family transcriptional regulator n=1 Tax=unclassified Acidovorax TaxID=2684926 RepID=UPI000C18AE94|nr:MULTISPECIES: LysR substrate-binding domain-containing protein [unclassified Acidovorax]PIF20132.1 DNA-binding transcriptional LysR family regulator [Acidovorax sp. 59]PKW00844.1 DNA-binding transcriptional LysR family regulator [Acidovorax sp. 30]